MAGEQEVGEESDTDEAGTEVSSFQESDAESFATAEEVEDRERCRAGSDDERNPKVVRRASCPSWPFDGGPDLIQANPGKRLSLTISKATLSQEGLEVSSWKEKSWSDRIWSDAEAEPPSADIEDGGSLAPEGTVLFFDWDDTLLPTSAVCQGGFSGSPPEEALPALATHATLVRDLLHAARSLGNVGIVTLAQRPWVQFTAERYLPGVDWEKEFQDLNIPIVYAREALSKSMKARAVEEQGVNLYVTSKTAAMVKVLKQLRLTGKSLNVLSFGDSSAEMEAARELAWSQDEEHQCKTVKLRAEPATVEELSAELREVMSWIRLMTHLDIDFDIELDKANDPDSPLRKASKGSALHAVPAEPAR